MKKYQLKKNIQNTIISGEKITCESTLHKIELHIYDNDKTIKDVFKNLDILPEINNLLNDRKTWIINRNNNIDFNNKTFIKNVKYKKYADKNGEISDKTNIYISLTYNKKDSICVDFIKGLSSLNIKINVVKCEFAVDLLCKNVRKIFNSLINTIYSPNTRNVYEFKNGESFTRTVYYNTHINDEKVYNGRIIVYERSGTGAMAKSSMNSIRKADRIRIEAKLKGKKLRRDGIITRSANNELEPLLTVGNFERIFFGGKRPILQFRKVNKDKIKNYRYDDSLPLQENYRRDNSINNYLNHRFYYEDPDFIKVKNAIKRSFVDFEKSYYS